MRYFHKIAMTLILSAAASMAWGQTKVTGTITDENGAPLPGVSVIEAGTANGTSSDPDGKYSITISGDNPALLFSCIGFSDHNEKVSGRTVIDVTMQEDMTVLDDVVVVGYGTQKKINITGSVTSINFEDKMAGRPVLSASASLAGLSAGLNVTQTSGQPGQDNATLRIRGNNSITSSANSPLVLVDGIEWSMDNVNPNDIASISVLKDAASTAIYGTRAANGVILITTKQGEEGKARISYSYSGIIQNAFTNGLEFVSDYPTHMQLINEGAERRRLGDEILHLSRLSRQRGSNEPLQYRLRIQEVQRKGKSRSECHEMVQDGGEDKRTPAGLRSGRHRTGFQIPRHIAWDMAWDP